MKRRELLTLAPVAAVAATVPVLAKPKPSIIVDTYDGDTRGHMEHVGRKAYPMTSNEYKAYLNGQINMRRSKILHNLKVMNSRKLSS